MNKYSILQYLVSKVKKLSPSDELTYLIKRKYIRKTLDKRNDNYQILPKGSKVLNYTSFLNYRLRNWKWTTGLFVSSVLTFLVGYIYAPNECDNQPLRNELIKQDSILKVLQSEGDTNR